MTVSLVNQFVVNGYGWASLRQPNLQANIANISQKGAKLWVLNLTSRLHKTVYLL